QVLGVAAGDLAAQGARFLHREQRRMVARRRLDAEPGKEGEQVFTGFRHGGSADWPGSGRLTMLLGNASRQGKRGDAAGKPGAGPPIAATGTDAHDFLLQSAWSSV